MKKLPCEELNFGQIPSSFNRDYTIKSLSGSGTSYTVNPYAMTCTCPDFLKHRQHKSIDSAGRLCKHLIVQLNEICQRDTSIHVAFRAIISRAEKFKMPRYFGAIETSLGQAIIFYDAGDDWINIVAPYEWVDGNEGDALYYGFNVIEQRWSYGVEPENGDEIARALS